jgi:hypothetical protein
VTLTNPATSIATFTAPAFVPGTPLVTLGFTLSVNNGALTTTAPVTVIVTLVPIADAGAPQTVPSGSVVTLNGTASRDTNTPPQPLTFLWTQTSGPAVTITNATTTLASFTAPFVPAASPPSVFGFLLTVRDGTLGATAATTVTVSPGKPPVVSPGAPQTVVAGTAVTLDASASVDPNTPPFPGFPPLRFAWVQTAGTPVVVLTSANTARATFVAPDVPLAQSTNTLTFAVTVNDGAAAATASTTVTITARAPIANAGAAQTVPSGSTVTLNGGASRDANAPARPLTFLWTQTSGTTVTLVNSTTSLATFTAPFVPAASPAAVFGFLLTVSNGPVSATAPVTITVSPGLLPAVAFGGTQLVPQGTTATLDASPTVDPNTPPFAPLTFAWVQTGGTPVVVLTNANTSRATFLAPNVPAGQTSFVLTFAVTVNNGAGSVTASRTLTITLLAPIANAGPAQSVRSRAGTTVVTLNGTGSSDPNTPPLPLTFHWTQTAGTAVTLATPNAATTTFTTPVIPGGGGAPPITLVFTLTVSNGVLSATSTVAITVAP